MTRRHAPWAIPAAVLWLTACSTMPPAPTAPEACGFPEDTEFVFAGRSTTAALEVEEVPGDPLSHQLADIYVTRDEHDQGDLRGRLVCAIFVDPPGFVEITVAPEGWDPETGRPPSTALPSMTTAETPQASAPDDILTRDEALAAAHGAAPGTEDWQILGASVGPIREVNPNWNLFDWSRDLPVDTWIWSVAMRSGDEGVFVFLDAADGTIYEATPVFVD